MGRIVPTCAASSSPCPSGSSARSSRSWAAPCTRPRSSCSRGSSGRSRLYEATAKNLLRVAIELVGGVEGSPTVEATPPKELAVRKGAGNVVELGSIAAFGFSPLWLLAGASDIARGSRVYLEALVGELKQADVLGEQVAGRVGGRAARRARARGGADGSPDRHPAARALGAAVLARRAPVRGRLAADSDRRSPRCSARSRRRRGARTARCSRSRRASGSRFSRPRGTSGASTSSFRTSRTGSRFAARASATTRAGSRPRTATR